MASDQVAAPGEIKLLHKDTVELTRKSQTGRLVRRLFRNRGAMIGLFIVTTIVIMALSAPILAPFDPDEQFSGRRLEPPGKEFPLGTDNLRRDLLSRLIYGARPSIGSAALATLVIITIGVAVGCWAGYVGGLLDDLAMRVVDVLLAFPTLILALAIVGILGPGLGNALIAVCAVVWAGYARLVQSHRSRVPGDRRGREGN